MPYDAVNMEEILSLCRRRGFIFPSSEIYGGLAGFFDYGPLGSQMRKNIKDLWWCSMTQWRDGIVGIDTAIILHPRVWEASGHLHGFTDPMVDCKASKMRYRADQLFFARVIVEGETIGYVSVLDGIDKQVRAEEEAQKLKRRLAKKGELKPIQLLPYTDARSEEYVKIPSPATGQPGTLTPPRAFNLMFQTHVGALEDTTSTAYLRPETAQGIFVNFKNILDSTRVKLPFGIAQIGRSFRNEITPRNFIFRSREFEQMEMEFFIDDSEESWQHWYSYWIEERLRWHRSLGIRPEWLGLEVHPREKLAHYSRACTDITFRYPFGAQELEGIAARGDFDLRQHQKASGVSMEYFDETTRRRFLPHVIEPALGVDRLFLALLCSAYDEDEIEGEKRNVLRLHPAVAPIKAAIFPLVKNKPELVELAENLHRRWRKKWPVAYDASGAIGRRYRRMDEIGTPFCITVDFQSLEDGTFTLRDRDSTRQLRLSEAEITAEIDSKLSL
ncbi:MAG: glycine--tRNA ligase [Puniceicoccales bacterium]|jgi:glycyl-tRNA synthetase|nr:glycine--tRNA ligase [Puniceicoccales bacterium]